ncbi:hypothetical protein N483_05955 [Pseudoalteromonas luteoviolacea NCIMB 1944]|uniref:Uncharacterized protein n=1 Tax=Pseudoalteromonas luteoviolacea (strain 2ta16) TaxID=1353533 RepID=V4HVY3_PSEL2|nr:hypothetical protein PL2TA16_02841 [Pseudoalteromonas luteoviolacea 2ta16]KZN31365.1 hypothetical protein N483_05955 [Pseudoalteromonas luteoviolacea NCIMB 1944]
MSLCLQYVDIENFIARFMKSRGRADNTKRLKVGAYTTLGK